MTPDRIPHLEAKVDDLINTLHSMHVDIVREIQDTVESALDRHVIHCPMAPRIDSLEKQVELDCPLAPRVEALERREDTKSVWSRLGPWAIIIAAFSLGALVVSGVLEADVLKALLPF